MTCQDNCLYYPLCRDSGFLMYHVRIKNTLTLTENVEKECPFKKFKNKADFVEVVRCKDCTFARKMVSGDYSCRVDHRIAHSEDDFCSYGKRSDA